MSLRENKVTHNMIDMAQVALFHISKALDKAHVFADTTVGSEIVSDLKAAKSNLLAIKVTPADLMDKI